MRIVLVALVVVLCLTVMVGCANPYFNPDTSKALTEQTQLKETQQQTAIMERQMQALERIANALEAQNRK